MLKDSSFRSRVWIGLTLLSGLNGSLVGCASTSPQTSPDSHTTFEPGIKPDEAVEAPAAAAATPDAALANIDPVPGSNPSPGVSPPQSATLHLQERVDFLENRVTALNEKLDATRVSLENAGFSKAERVAAVPHPAEDLGDEIETTPTRRDPEAGFTNNNAIRAYRQAMILFRSGKHADAILSFSTFLQSYADHPLAGSAQFYVGEAYFRQKEYRLAAQEYQRVLTAYDRSPHVTTALKQLATSHESLQMHDEANKNKQMLSSLFPQSPAAEPLFNALAASAPPPPVAPEAPVSLPPAVDAIQGEKNTPEIPATAPLETSGP